MRHSKQVALAAGALSILTAVASWGGELGSAVIERLGQVVPTPAPSPLPEEKIRLIASITVQNKPSGETSFTFEAADFGERENGQFRIIAIEQYSLIEPKPEAVELRDRIVEQLRALERDLLSYVEVAGPPREPQKLFELGGGARPYP